jgi:L-rhamnonate dehydratase
MDPMRTGEVRTAMLLQLSRKTPTGAFGCSMSLIDIALWDIKGKATGQPVWKLLGGTHCRLPAYITFGLGQYTQEELVEAAKMLVAEGHDKLKMVVATGSNPIHGVFGQPTDNDITRDVERVRAVREAVGDKVELMIDANQNATYTYASRLANLLEPYNLTWFEDPVLFGDPRLMARLRRETPIPIAGGSSGTSDLIRFREYLLNEAVDYAQPNVNHIGGFTGGLKAASLAEAFNIQLQMGGAWPHSNMHLHGAVPNGGRIEFHWKSWKLIETYFDHGQSPVNGWVTLPEAPGLGFTPKSGIVKEYAVE